MTGGSPRASVEGSSEGDGAKPVFAPGATGRTERSLSWTWKRFDDLTNADVYALLALRSEVFVVEQACVFLDPDGSDQQAWHLLARSPAAGPDAALVGYLRCLDAGLQYPEPSIGRVAVPSQWRDRTIGRALMIEGIARSRAAWPGRDIVINAQHRLERFYRSLGFEAEGSPYVEDGIDHVAMRLVRDD